MDGTILGQGTFTQGATAVAQTIVIPSGVDWLQVINLTQAGGVAGSGFRFYWQRGFSVGGDSTIGIVESSGGAGVVSVAQTAAGAFVLYDPSQPELGPAIAITGSTNATQPVISTGSTAGLVSGSSVVRLSGITAQQDLGGIDFIVDTVVANTSFRIQNALATAPGAAGTNGFWRLVKFPSLFYPRRRIIAAISQAANASVRTTVPHGYTVGQELRFNIPPVSGMVQLNPSPLNNYLSAVVVSVTDANNFVINIDTSAFSAFTFPTAAQMPSTFPEVIPFGEDTAQALSSSVDILADATVNTGFLGMTLAAGALMPAGAANDVVFWLAGKSTYGGL